MGLFRPRTVFAFARKNTERMISKLQRKQIVHFLHIGKTGGTAIKFALKPFRVNDRFVVHLHPHRITLRDVPIGDSAIFFLRDPIARFVSGFYSRQRQGQPRILSPWSPEEKAAFEFFETPNQLAVALSSPREEERMRARQAMTNISHVKNHYRDWLESEEYLLSRRDDLFFVGFQESLAEDFARLKQKLCLPAAANLPGDDVHAHRNPRHLDYRLGEIAVENLKNWYREDYRFINLCKEVFEARSSESAKRAA